MLCDPGSCRPGLRVVLNRTNIYINDLHALVNTKVTAGRQVTVGDIVLLVEYDPRRRRELGRD